MKAISILIDSSTTINELNYLETQAEDDLELEVVLDIYKYHGYEEAKRSLRRTPLTPDQLKTLAGKQIRTVKGWIDVIQCLPVADSTRWMMVLSDKPHVARIVDGYGYNANLHIYQVRDTPKSTKQRGRPRKESKPLISPEQVERMHQLEDKTGMKSTRSTSNLMTEPDIPFAPRGK